MPRINPEEKKAKLREKLAAIEHQLQQADAQVKIAQKKQEIRRQILTGKLALNEMAQHPFSSFSQKLLSLLDCAITGKDRALFPGLDTRFHGANDATSSEMVHSPIR
jgi:hypothetical protein